MQHWLVECDRRSPPLARKEKAASEAAAQELKQ